MKLNFKTLAYFVSGAIMIAAPIALIKSTHYSPRFEGDKKNTNPTIKTNTKPIITMHDTKQITVKMNNSKN